MSDEEREEELNLTSFFLGKKSEVNAAAEVALRLIRPGKKKNKDVTEAIQEIAAAYDCKIAEGVLSHQMKQFVIDGNKVVLSVSNPETSFDGAEFEENEVYSIDIVTSSGEGKPKLLNEKQTIIYKRAVDKNYLLKMKASRFVFSEISRIESRAHPVQELQPTKTNHGPQIEAWLALPINDKKSKGGGKKKKGRSNQNPF